MSGDIGGWGQLPGEIRHEILGYLSLPGWKASLFAPVGREWQSMIEPHNFAEISLTTRRLAAPNTLHILFRKRRYIRRICFDVPLRRYNPRTMHPGHRTLDSAAVIAFERLFTALGTWGPRGDLVLSINGREPRDEAWLRHTSTRDIPNPTTPIPDDEMEWWRGLPVVRVVKVVLIHTSSRVGWNPAALSSMFTRFPNMKELSHEGRWDSAAMALHWNQHTDQRLGNMVRSLVGTRLRKLVLFPKVLPMPLWTDLEYFDPALGRNIARVSQVLVSLSASFIFDASDFFAARQANWLWEKLTYLALTINNIPPKGGSEMMLNHVFRDAAASALFMPRLDTMELWNGRRGEAVLFRYQKAQDGQSAVITVRGSFELPLEAEVIDAWEKVARRHRHGKLIIQTSLIHPLKISGLRSAIRHLGLSNETAGPFLK